MKIVGYSISNDMIRVITDNLSRPEFVYPSDKFDSMDELRVEIEKSIALEAKRKAVKSEKTDKLAVSLDAEVKPK